MVKKQLPTLLLDLNWRRWTRMAKFITKQNRVFKLNQGKRTFTKEQLNHLRSQPEHIPASQMSAKDISDLKSKKQQFLVNK